MGDLKTEAVLPRIKKRPGGTVCWLAGPGALAQP